MEDKKFIKELFEYPCESFKMHIESNENSRIIFSGRFGIGKTEFLKHFFKEETQNDSKVFGRKKYNAFHIYPINYSVANNEDVFRYVKYDLITSMILHNIPVEENIFSYSDTLPEYLKKIF